MAQTSGSAASQGPSPQQTQIVLITGPSGGGRTTAIRALEDAGFEPMDNVPLSLVPRLVDGPLPDRPMALGIGVRNRDFSANAMIELIDWLTLREDVSVEVLFLEARADVLEARYSETRRRHPLAPDESPGQGIAREIDLLAPIRARAEHLIDTSDMTVHDTRAEVERRFVVGGQRHLALSVHSFSYKRGLPRGMDMVFDVRFLRNPYWDPNLRALDGRDDKVAAYVGADDRFEAFFAKVIDLAELLLPAYMEEGKAHLAIAFGCTGGQHRSVMVAEKLTETLGKSGWQVSKRHRELERRALGQGSTTPGDKRLA